MEQCSIYDNSLRFARTVFGSLALVAFLVHNLWLVLIIVIIMAIGIISNNYNIFYQFHYRILKPLLKDSSGPIFRDANELRCACGLATIFLTIAFIFLYLGKLASIAWALVLIVALLMLLAGIVNICVASLIYAGFKKITKR